MDAFGQLLLVAVIVGSIVALIGFWLMSRYAPRGTVLVVAAVFYLLSWAIDPGRSRELIGLVGFLRLVGFAGGILGIIDLVRRRTPKNPEP